MHAVTYELDDRGMRVRIPAGGGAGDVIFPLASRPALGSALSPVQWVLGVKLQGR
jgi:hypothetical protein